MSVTTALGFPVATGDQLAEIAWSTVTHVETQDENFFSKSGMTAKDTGREMSHERKAGVPIILKDELRRGPGEEVRVRMRRQLTRTPRTSTYTYGTTSMTGNEEALVYLHVHVPLWLLKTATGHDSPDVTYHRTSIDLEQDSEDALKEWLIENHEEAILDCFYDKYPYFVIADTIGPATASVAHPRTYYAGSKAGAGQMEATDILNAREAQRMRSYAINRRLNPIRMDGAKCFCVLADTFTLNDLKNDPAYAAAQQNANSRGSNNPMITGAVGEYNHLYFHEYERMRRTTSGANAGNIGQIALLGADALAIVYGSEPRLVPRSETSYGDRWGRAIRQVFGGARTDFVNQTGGASANLNQSSAQWNVWEVRDEFAQ